MRLVADRFVVYDDRRAVDLATTRPVWLSLDRSGEVDERRWAARCDDLHRLRHPSVAPLVDYGSIGTLERFEAWMGAGAWRGAGEHARNAIVTAATFLRALSLTSGDEAAFHVVHGETGAVSVLPGAAGYAIDAVIEPSSPPANLTPGISIVDRPAVTALAEMFVTVNERRPRAAVLWGASGSGLDTAILVLARAARVHGFVPVDARLLQTHRQLLDDRSLFIIERRVERLLQSWLYAVLRCSRPHVCVLVSAEELRGVDAVALTRIGPDALANAVRPVPPGVAAFGRLRREAERTLGLPGPFVRSLWPAPLADRGPRTVAGLSRVAEEPAAYGVLDAYVPIANDVEPAPIVSRTWPAPGELARLRRQVETGTSMLTAGRHAPGLRVLRQAIGGLARRDAWEDAARAGVRLATEILQRGRPRDALRVLDDAREHAVRCGDASLLLDVGITSAEAWTDLARLDAAERAFRGALVSARAAGDGWRASLVSTGLARCLFWRAEYGEAASLASGDASELTTAPATVRRLRLLARTRVADGATTDAMTALAEARERADAHGDARLLVDVEHTEAFVRSAMGDLDGAERHVAACLEAARATRRPLRALSARLMQIDVERRRNRVSDSRILEPLRRLAMTAPPLIRARWDVLKIVLERPDDPVAVEQQAALSGLRALTLFARPVMKTTGAALTTDGFVEETLAILRICQHADDELTLLAEICGLVRQQLHAAAVAFIAASDGRAEPIVHDGPRIDLPIAERAIETGLTIAPHRVQERLEAAATVMYGGRAIGALCVRWTVGGTDDLSRAPGLLSMAATAAAPIVSALLVRRTQARTPTAPDLLGITSAMSDLRRAVERAAPAPFAVLIEGESGSGKELVARAIHRGSPRRDRTFCTLNCAALPDDLVEAELFGHARGAFTGAVADRAGVFEEAHGGTLFLDEIGELSPRAQAKILRVIQEGELRRVGENTARRIDTRIVSATNRDLRREVEAGRFRLDLSYRLDVIHISVPPLRDRRDDVAVLVDHFWSDATRRIGSHATLAATTRSVLARYHWPGNVRELQNVMAALAVRCPKRGIVPPSALPPHLVGAIQQPAAWELASARRTFEEGFVRAALARSGGHRGRTAADLGVTRQGLTKLMSRLGIED